jgi:hypothetical protein
MSPTLPAQAYRGSVPRFRQGDGFLSLAKSIESEYVTARGSKDAAVRVARASMSQARKPVVGGKPIEMSIPILIEVPTAL